MSDNSALSMAQALQKKSQEKAQLIEKAAILAFHEQEQAIKQALSESSNTISGAISDRNEDLINALNSLMETYKQNNKNVQRALLKSWGIMLIGLVFLLLLGGSCLWYQGQKIATNYAIIESQNQRVEALEAKGGKMPPAHLCGKQICFPQADGSQTWTGHNKDGGEITLFIPEGY